jgi:hypothetical protein
MHQMFGKILSSRDFLEFSLGARKLQTHLTSEIVDHGTLREAFAV